MAAPIITRLFRPWPRPLARVFSVVILALWLIQMARLVQHERAQASPSLAGDLGRYGSAAQWRGVYNRGEKVGFFVSLTTPLADGYEISEDGQLQMSLLGMPVATRIQSSVRADRAFQMKSFSFALDPGSGPIRVSGALEGKRLTLSIQNSAGTRSETRELSEPPALALNLSRQLAALGIATGKRFNMQVFDPATLRNMPMAIDVGRREVIVINHRPVPAFRVVTRFIGLESTSWVTDLGETLREESPLGWIIVKETQERATALAVPGEIQGDLLRNVAVAPEPPLRIDDPTTVASLRLRISGLPESMIGPDLEGAGQRYRDGILEVVDTEPLPGQALDPDALAYLKAEPFIESDDPAIQQEADRIRAGAKSTRILAERLVRQVHAMIDKRPTVGLPSAVEVLRTRVGDCNEHTALYAALARACGLPARIAVGLVYLQGSFYYHAWAEVYVAHPDGGHLWLPADPTLNQFPADATHVRLLRGGLDRQTQILPLIGHLRLQVIEARLRPGTPQVLVGRHQNDLRPIEIALPKRKGRHFCWSRPMP